MNQPRRPFEIHLLVVACVILAGCAVLSFVVPGVDGRLSWWSTSFVKLASVIFLAATLTTLKLLAERKRLGLWMAISVIFLADLVLILSLTGRDEEGPLQLTAVAMLTLIAAGAFRRRNYFSNDNRSTRR